MLRLEKIKAGYKRKIIVSDINFVAKNSELVGLLGLNGEGKTTLLKTISGLIDRIDGKCFINDLDCFNINSKDRAKLISYMPQRHSIIYDIKVIDVVLMGITPYLKVYETPNKLHKERAYQILKKIGMEEYSEDNFLYLSEGQKQLIIIARTLMQDADVMLFDEPDSALDFNNKHMILSKIKEIIKNENKTGIITLHDPNFALEYCDKIIIINNRSISSEFYIKDVNIEILRKNLNEIYSDVDIILYKDKYVLMR